MSAEGVQEHPPPGITLVGPAHSEPQQVAKAGALADRADDVFEAARKLLASLPRGLRNRRRTTPKYSDAVGKGDAKAKDDKKKKKGDLKDGAKLGGLVAETLVKDAALEPERPKFWTLVEDSFRVVEAEDVAMCLQLDPRVDPDFLIPPSGRHYSAVWANEDVGFGEGIDAGSDQTQIAPKLGRVAISPSASFVVHAEGKAPKKGVPPNLRPKRMNISVPKKLVSREEQIETGAKQLLKACQESELAQLVKQVATLRALSFPELASEAGVEDAVLMSWLEDPKTETDTDASCTDVSILLARWLRGQAPTTATPSLPITTSQPPPPLAATEAMTAVPASESTPGDLELPPTTSSVPESVVALGEDFDVQPPSAAPVVIAPEPSAPQEDAMTVDQPQGLPVCCLGEGDTSEAPSASLAAFAEIEGTTEGTTDREQEHALAHQSEGTTDREQERALAHNSEGTTDLEQERALAHKSASTSGIGIGIRTAPENVLSGPRRGGPFQDQHSQVALWQSDEELSVEQLKQTAIPFPAVGITLATEMQQRWAECSPMPTSDQFLHPFTSLMIQEVLRPSFDAAEAQEEDGKTGEDAAGGHSRVGVSEAEEPDASDEQRTAIGSRSRSAPSGERSTLRESGATEVETGVLPTVPDGTAPRAPSPGRPSYRCSTCLIAKKGGCGTEHAVPKCLRRSHNAALQEGSELSNLAPRAGCGIVGAGSDRTDAAGRNASETMEEHAKRLATSEIGALLVLAPSDEVTGELLCAQNELLSLLAANRERQRVLLKRMMDAHPEETAKLQRKAIEKVEVDTYVTKLKEEKRVLKRERREREQAAQAAAAIAAADNSTRKGHLRRDLPLLLSDSNAPENKPNGGSHGEKARPSKRPRRESDDDEESSDDDHMLVDHLVDAGTNEEEALCVICGNGDSEVPNQIVCCERCGVWVHERCYGIHEIPEGEWLCWPCRVNIDPEDIKCAMCPVRRGAFKRTNCGKWVHVVCAHWMPEVTVLDKDSDIAVEGLDQIPKERYQMLCHVCNRKEGACLQCNYGHCQGTFHPLCARSAGSFVNMREAGAGRFMYRAYCDKHSQMQRDKQDERLKVQAAIAEKKQRAHSNVATSKNLCLAALQTDLERFRHLRGDFERLRLLCERVAKRERLKADRCNTLCQLAANRAADAAAGGSPDSTPVSTPARLGRPPKIGIWDGESGASGAAAGGKGSGKGKGAFVGGIGKGKKLKGAAAAAHAASMANNPESRVKVDRECFMTSGEAEVTNSRLPKGYLYVPLDAFTSKDR